MSPANVKSAREHLISARWEIGFAMFLLGHPANQSLQALRDALDHEIEEHDREYGCKEERKP